MQVRKQQLEPDMEHQTASKLGKEYVKAVYGHPAYLTYMYSTLEKEMAVHSSILAWRILWIEEPGGLLSIGSQSRIQLRLVIFLPEILIEACALSSPAFHMMHSAYKLYNQGDKIQP